MGHTTWYPSLCTGATLLNTLPEIAFPLFGPTEIARLSLMSDDGSAEYIRRKWGCTWARLPG